MWSRLSFSGSWSLPVLAVCAACCCKALLPLWNLSVDREHLGPGRASSLLGAHMYREREREGWGFREVDHRLLGKFTLYHLCISLLTLLCPLTCLWPSLLVCCPPFIAQTLVVCFMNGCFDGCFFYSHQL